MNFKDETTKMIADRKVDEYYFYHEPSEQIYKGSGEIDWNTINPPKSTKVGFGFEAGGIEYDNGYGNEVWRGWVTFKNSNEWIARMEYDGSEWWEEFKKPTLLSGGDARIKGFAKEE